MKFAHYQTVFLFAFVANFGLISANAIPPGSISSGSDSSPSNALPEGMLRFVDGRVTRDFVLSHDKIVVKPPGQMSEIQDFASLFSNAALGAYMTGEEQLAGAEMSGLIAYPAKYVGDEKLARLVTRKIAVCLMEGSRDIDGALLIGEVFGIEHLREQVGASGWTVFEAAGVVEAILLADGVAAHPLVATAYVVLGVPYEKKVCTANADQAFFPDDPLYGSGEGGRFQGYFFPPSAVGSDGWLVGIELRPVWENPGLLLDGPYTGERVRIAIADDGLEIRHEDLRSNTFGNPHRDWIDDDSDPTGAPGDFHGTWVGGIAGAVGGNGKGITGVAPECDLVGLRFLDLFTDDDVIGQVLEYRWRTIDVHNNSWGPPDNARLASGPGPMALDALDDTDQIYIWANGNGGTADNSNYDGYANHIKTLAVSAVNSLGLPASYSESGSNIVCAGLAADGAGGQIVTTDENDGYVETGVEGTSFAAPMVAGVVALMLEARPELGWRDVQEILIATGVVGASGGNTPNGGVVSPSVADDPVLAIPNEGGYVWDFSERKGYGLVNAEQAVRLAEKWALLPSRVTVVSRTERVGEEIGAEMQSFEFDFSRAITPNIRIEHATVTLFWEEGSDDAPVDCRLVSTTFAWGPAEYWSQLSAADHGVDLPEEWTMSSVGHWGQLSGVGAENGLWRVDVGDGGGRELESIEVTFYGSRANGIPSIANADIVTANAPSVLNPQQASTDQDLILTNIEVRDLDFDNPRIAYQWQERHPDCVTWRDVAGASGQVVEGDCQWLPVANFTVAPVAPQLGDPAQFSDNSTAETGTIVSWLWDFGDGGVSAEQNPVYTFTSSSDVTVTLTVTNNFGDTSTMLMPDFVVLGVGEPAPDPLPVLPVNSAATVGLCKFSSTVTLPASSTEVAAAYRVQLRPRDQIQEGSRFTTSAVIVIASEPPLPAGGDADNDSVINMLEKAFATDPHTVTSPAFGLPVVGTTNVPGASPTDHLSITFRIPNSAVFDPASQTYTWTDVNGDVYLYETQCSTGLVTWDSADGLAGDLFRDSVTVAPDDPANVNLVTYRMLEPMPGSDPLKYLRIKITLTPAA